MIPTLETQHLILRGPTLDDFADSAALWGDPEVVRYIGGDPFTEEDVWGRLMRYVGHWTLLGFGYWMVRDKAGNFVGEVGFADHHRHIAPPITDPELGWAITRSAQGQGYATEAVQAALAWGTSFFGSHAFACIIDPGNVASIRVAEKCGFHAAERTTYKGDKTIIFRRPSLVPADLGPRRDEGA